MSRDALLSPSPHLLHRPRTTTGIDKSALEDLRPSGFYSEDPTDVLNGVLALPIDLAGVQEYLDRVAESKGQQGQGQGQQEAAAQESKAGVFAYKGEAYTNKLLAEIASCKPLETQIKKLSNLVPHADVVIFTALLGKPDKTMEITTHKYIRHHCSLT